MKTIRAGCSRLACSLTATMLFSSFVQAETLQEVYKLARQKDPRFRAVQAETQASSTILDQARAGFLPTVRFSIEESKTKQAVLYTENPLYNTGSMTYPTNSQTLSVTQPIFRKDVIERFNQAKSVVKQAQYTLLAAEQDLQLRTVAAYLLVLAAKDSVTLAVAEREAIAKLRDRARESRKAGLGTITQLNDADARFAVTQAREIEAEHKLRDAREGLREITGTAIERVQALRDVFPLETPKPAKVEEWLASAFEQNMVLRARFEAIDVARLEAERQRASYYPSLTLSLTQNRKDAGSTLYGNGSDVKTTDATLQLVVPIYDGGLTSAVSKEASFRLQKAHEEYDLEHRAVERATRAAFSGVVAGVNLIQALKKSVSAQESAVEAKLEGYKSGLNTLLPVLDAQRDLFLAKRDYAQSRYDYLINRLKLKQSAGTLSEEDLHDLSGALQ